MRELDILRNKIGNQFGILAYFAFVLDRKIAKLCGIKQKHFSVDGFGCCELFLCVK